MFSSRPAVLEHQSTVVEYVRYHMLDRFDIDFRFSNMATILSFMPEIVDMILGNIHTRHIGLCSLVCKFWQASVNRIMKKRQHLNWFTIECDKAPYIYGRKRQDKTNESNIICKNIMKNLENLTCKPEFVFAVLPENLGQYDEELKACLQLVLPIKTLVGVYVDDHLCNPINTEKGIMQYIIVPQLSGVKVYHFSPGIDGPLDENCYDFDDYEISRESLKICTGIPVDEEVKFLLWYAEEYGPGEGRGCQFDFGAAFGHIYKDCFSGGTLCNGFFAPENSPYHDDKGGPLYIAFCGEGIQALPITGTIKEIEKMVEQINRDQLHNGNTFAWLLADTKTFAQKVTGIFSKHFPDVPLFGHDSSWKVGYLPSTKVHDSSSCEVSSVLYKDIPTTETDEGVVALLVIISFGEKNTQ